MSSSSGCPIDRSKLVALLEDRADDTLRAHVGGMVVGAGMRPVLFGVALGLVVAVALVRVLEGLLYGMGALDPWIALVAPVTMVAVSVAACYWPARWIRSGRWLTSRAEGRSHGVLSPPWSDRPSAERFAHQLNQWATLVRKVLSGRKSRMSMKSSSQDWLASGLTSSACKKWARVGAENCTEASACAYRPALGGGPLLY